MSGGSKSIRDENRCLAATFVTSRPIPFLHGRGHAADSPEDCQLLMQDKRNPHNSVSPIMLYRVHLGIRVNVF
jgi:hypothetical protein